MASRVMLDSGPLGMITHPRPNPEIAEWFKSLFDAGVSFLLPEIADYEVRRELIRANRRKGVARLDELKETIEYVAILTPAMIRAAEFWAESRNQGFPTADDAALDGDVILAGQVVVASETGDSVILATTNVGHLSRFVDARLWSEIRITDSQ